MASTHYAWSPIRGDKDAAFGDTVTKDKLGVSQEDWDAMVEAGSIRTTKPPKLPDGWQGSVIEYYQQQAKEAAEAAGASADEAALAAFQGREPGAAEAEEA